jgi:hypothetical protein
MGKKSHWLHYCAVALLGVGLVAAALQLGGGREQTAVAAPPMAPYFADDELPVYPNASEYPLGDALSVNGLPMRLPHFSTGDSAVRVRDFYLEAFARMGVKTRLISTMDGGFSVSAVVSGGSGQAVVLIAPRGRTTEVFPSVFPVAADALEPQVADSDVPFSPNAVGLLKLGDKADGQGEAVNWQEPLMKVSEAAAFVKDEMARRGWGIAQFDQHHGSKGSGARVVALKAGRKAVFLLTPYQHQPVGAAVVAQYATEESL